MQPVSFTIKAAVFAFLMALVAVSVRAGSPREELQKVTAQLQNAPADAVLREKIVKLALKVKPLPPLPEEAQRHMARGSAAFKGATSTADFQEAAKEFELAVLAAPWSSDAYFNLGVAQDKAGSYAAALTSLQLARVGAADISGIKELIYEVEYRSEKARSPGAMAAAKPAGPDFSGCWQDPGMPQCEFLFEPNGDSWIVRDATKATLTIARAEGRQLWLDDARDWLTQHYEIVLSEDGQTMEVVWKQTQSAEEFSRMERERPGARIILDGSPRPYMLRRK